MKGLYTQENLKSINRSLSQSFIFATLENYKVYSFMYGSSKEQGRQWTNDILREVKPPILFKDWLKILVHLTVETC